MTYKPSLKVKPAVLVTAALDSLNDKLTISNTVTKRSDMTTFFASAGDTISQRVKGTVPVRTYTARNDRSLPIITDNYEETVVTLTISADRPYSAIKMTDEQLDWDFQDGWGDIIDAQTEAISSYLEHAVLRQILQAPYEAIVKVAASDPAGQDRLYNAIVDAKKALRLMRCPVDSLVMVCGVDFEEKIIKGNRLIKDQGTGNSALTTATMGTLAGVTLVSSTHIPADEAYMYAKSGFLVFTGTPKVPASVPFGTTASAGGWALRWLMDYDTAYLTDRSVFDTYAGYSYVTDYLSVFDGTSRTQISPEKYFVRGVRIVLDSSAVAAKEPGDGSTDTPGGSASSFLAKVWNQQDVTPVEVIGEPFPLGGNYPGAKANAKAHATVSAGKLTDVVVDVKGFGYTSTPAVTFSGGAGTGAAATAVIANGEVVDVVITNVGSGYTSAPTVAIAAA
jgi:hypothetical protein